MMSGKVLCKDCAHMTSGHKCRKAIKEWNCITGKFTFYFCVNARRSHPAAQPSFYCDNFKEKIAKWRKFNEYLSRLPQLYAHWI
jgi:hypothetical protein